MAIRVRKLARQLGRAPEDLVDLLQVIGLSRYSSPNHMLPAHAEDALREAVRKMPPGRRPAPVRPPTPRPAPTLTPKSGMQQVVPGVVPIDTPPANELALESHRQHLERAKASLEKERESLAALRQEAEAERDALRAERAQLEARQTELDGALAATRRERSALRERVEFLQKEREEDHTFLAYMLHERGLRGMDECERAIAALARRRQLRPILELLRCDRPDRVRDVLDQRLVLVGGAIPDALPDTLAAVSVAPDRADVPGERDLSRALARFGEILMLHGLRRLTVLGGRPAWHKTLREGLDPRVELRFVSRAQDIGVLTAADLCVVWTAGDATLPPGEHQGLLVHIQGDHLLSLLTGVEEFLRDGAS